MASVSVDDVRDVVRISSAEIPDAKLTKMIKRGRLLLSLKLTKKSTTAVAQMQRKSSSRFSPPFMQFVILRADLLRIKLLGGRQKRKHAQQGFSPRSSATELERFWLALTGVI